MNTFMLKFQVQVLLWGYTKYTYRCYKKYTTYKSISCQLLKCLYRHKVSKTHSLKEHTITIVWYNYVYTISFIRFVINNIFDIKENE